MKEGLTANRHLAKKAGLAIKCSFVLRIKFTAGSQLSASKSATSLQRQTLRVSDNFTKRHSKPK